MLANYDQIDWDYLNKKVQKLQCTKAIHSSCEWAKTQQEKFEAEKWGF